MRALVEVSQLAVALELVVVGQGEVVVEATVGTAVLLFAAVELVEVAAAAIVGIVGLEAVAAVPVCTVVAAEAIAGTAFVDMTAAGIVAAGGMFADAGALAYTAGSGVAV